MRPPRERGLAEEPTPLLGGLAIYAGVAVAGLLFLPLDARWHAVLAGATVITIVGAIDDWRDLPAVWKLAGQLAAGLILVLDGVVVQTFTLPFIGRVVLGDAAEPLTLLGLVALMNAVNFTDGVDGLAAGVCAISAVAFAVIAFDLGRDSAGDPGADHGGRGDRLPRPQLPSGRRLHGRLRVQPARPAARRDDRRGDAQDERLDRPDRPAGHPRRPVPRHDVRRAQADEVPPARLPRGRQPLPPPLRAHRLLAAAHRRVPVRLDRDDGGLAVALRFLPYSDGHGNFRSAGRC